MHVDEEKRVQILLDKQEIHEVLLRQARAFDRRDADLFSTIYHPGAMRRTPSGNLPQPDAQLNTITSYSPDRPASSHFIGNHLIEVEGDVAYSEAYFIIYSQDREEKKAFTCTRSGRYLDRFERKDGVWRIAYRVITDDWTRRDEVVETLDVSTHAYPARPSRDDALYRELREGLV